MSNNANLLLIYMGAAVVLADGELHYYCNTKKKRNSELDLGRLGFKLPARTGPEARLLGAGGTSLPSRSRFHRLHGGGGVVVDD
jgi:hypothetical protein